MAAKSDIDQIKFKAYKDLGIISDWNVVDGHWTFVSFAQLNDELVTCSFKHLCTDISGVSDFASPTVKTVERFAPADALTMVQRVVDGIVGITGPGEYTFDGGKHLLNFPKDRYDLSKWVTFYQDLVDQTETSLTSAHGHYKLTVYRGLKLVGCDEAPAKIRVCDGLMDFKPSRPGLEILGPFPTDRSIVRSVEKYGSKPGLAVAQLIFDRVLAHARVDINHTNDDRVRMQIVYGYIAEDKTIEVVYGPTYETKPDSRGKYSVNDLYQYVLNNVAVRRERKVQQDMAGSRSRVGSRAGTVDRDAADRDPASDRGAADRDPTQDPAFSFGRSTDQEGIFEILDNTADIVHMRKTDDGYWFMPTSELETSINTKPVISGLGQSDWVVAAFRFSKLYDLTKRYIILADCEEDDPTHPAAVLYRELLSIK